MRVSLKVLLLCVTLIAIAIWTITFESPIDRLEKKGASFGRKTTGDLFLMGFPYQWSNYIEQNAYENEHVEVIAYPREAKLREIDFRNLSNFPNLKALSIRGKISSRWLSHLKRCDKLRVFSYGSSTADDEAIEELLDHESVMMINVPGTDVTLDAKQTFRDSRPGRIAYP